MQLLFTSSAETFVSVVAFKVDCHVSWVAMWVVGICSVITEVASWGVLEKSCGWEQLLVRGWLLQYTLVAMAYD